MCVDAHYRVVMLPMTLGDPCKPQSTSIYTFCVAFHIFVVGDDRGFHFSTLVVRVASSSPWKERAWLRHVSNFYRVTLCWRGRPICCRRVSVCVSVCLSHAGIVLKRLIVWSRWQRNTLAQRLVFWSKGLGEIRTGSLLLIRGRQMQVG